jgi:hypothetical protein
VPSGTALHNRFFLAPCNYDIELWILGAKTSHKRQRYVDFNQGVDARQIVKHPERITKLAEIAIRPLRIAFDDWAFRGTYQKAVEIAIEAGIYDLSNYMLYNSDEENDTPVNLYKRLRMNVDLATTSLSSGYFLFR